jgi:hypothetical protein
MRWFARLLRVVPGHEREGIRLEDSECWRVEPTRDGAVYFRALATLASADSVLYMEDTTDREVAAFLIDRHVENPVKVAMGTIWPAPDRHHIPATSENLQALGALIHKHSVALPAIHTHLYCGNDLILEWYDAFTDDPIYVSRLIPESTVREFAGILSSEYAWAGHAV